MADETQEVIDGLDDLLDTERRLLLAGDLDGIARLHDRKVDLIERLNALDATDHAGLGDLNDKVGHNQALLKSALEGIRAVAQRLAIVRRIRGSLDTYDAEGRKKSLPLETSRNVEKRA